MAGSIYYVTNLPSTFFMPPASPLERKQAARSRIWDVFLIFLRLGCTSFGGPAAHLGYFHQEFVLRRRWLDERAYADLVALCQFLPGPASSQTGMAIGLARAGYAGAAAAWAGFTLPSALLMLSFAAGMATWGDFVSAGFLHGLKIAAVAVVAQAVWSMGQKLCTGTVRISIAIATACVGLFWTGSWVQIASIAVAAVVGLLILKPADAGGSDHQHLRFAIGIGAGIVCLGLFLMLLIGLPLLVQAGGGTLVGMIDAFYRAGSLVFGGGHVLLPLLQAEVVPNGWVSNETFMAGYGAAQAVPGPLFTFAAFLGASIDTGVDRWLSGTIAITAIFVPSFLLLCGVLPFWEGVRANHRMRAALDGINASVVGLLLAALYQPVWTSAISSAMDFGVALLAFGGITYWKLPPWLVVVASGLAGWALRLA